MRITLAAAVACFFLVAVTTAKDAQAAMRRQTNIPAQGLAPALRTLAKDRDVQLVYRTELVGDHQTSGAAGDLTFEEALTQLLSGTGLTYRYLENNAITIVPIPSDSSSTLPTSTQTGGSDTGAAVQGVPTMSQDTEQSSQILQEIIVTAEKRNERLQDVPVPVTVISAETLLQNNTPSIEDYASTVPGLNITTDSHGLPEVSIRGITTGTGNGNPTVAIAIDDLPYGSSSALGGDSTPVPDLDPSDLAQVEVLRGPQGTLYGASSLGGLIKYVTLDPSTSDFSGRVQTDLDGVQNGDRLGYGVRGAVNVPLSDSVAIRVSGFSREEPGYIENIQNGQRAVNRIDVDGGYFAALWRPSETFSAKLSALLQDNTGHGASTADNSLGILQQMALPGSGTYRDSVQLYTLNLTARYDDFDLKSISGYSVHTIHDDEDASYGFGPLFESGIPGTGFNGYGVSGSAFIDNVATRKFSEEIRLSSSNRWLSSLFGVFYTREESRFAQDNYAENAANGAVVATFLTATWPTSYEEYAGFANLTFHLTNRFDVQLGGRESQNRQTYSEVDSGPYALLFEGTDPLINPQVTTKDNSFTYLVTPRYEVSQDLMLYARLTSGYRPGGPNPTCTAFDVPCHFGPDSTRDYELGVKGQAMAETFSYDVSIYDIEWKNIQTQVLAPCNCVTIFTNAGGARSKGAELSTEWRPLSRTLVSASIALNDAVLTQAFPATSLIAAAPGDRLPNSSRFTANSSVEQTFPLADSLTGIVGGTLSYVGNRETLFVGAGQTRDQMPGYAEANLHVGLKHGSWQLNSYANNVANRRGILNDSSVPGFPFIQYIVPRTVGLSVWKTF